MKTKEVILFFVEGATDKESLGGIISELVQSKSKKAVIERNDRKKLNVDRLAFCPKIATIPYCMYYFSCNLEHVLHDEMNVPNEEKTGYAQDFSDQYEGVENEFVNFIRDGQFAVKGEYKETWEFIKRNGNSLKRYCNFHLFFQDIVSFD